MSQKMRVVLDTNILINALEAELEGPRANRRQFVAHAVTGHVFNRHEVFATAETLDELKRITTEEHIRAKYPDQMPAAKRFYKQVQRCVKKIDPATPEKECRADASDTAFLRAVAGAKAHVLITDDNDLLAEKSSNGARILNMWDFADEMMGIKLAPDFRFQLHQPIPPALQHRFTTLSQPPVKKDAYGRTKKSPKKSLTTWKSGLR